MNIPMPPIDHLIRDGQFKCMADVVLQTEIVGLAAGLDTMICATPAAQVRRFPIQVDHWGITVFLCESHSELWDAMGICLVHGFHNYEDHVEEEH